MELDRDVIEKLEEYFSGTGKRGVVILRKSDDVADFRMVGGLPVRKSEVLIGGIEEYLKRIGCFTATREDNKEYHIIIY